MTLRSTHWLYAAAWIAAVAAFVPVVLWLFAFWPPALPSGKDAGDAWNNFGTFIGGTVGPLLSLAAFLGLALSLSQASRSARERANEIEAQHAFDLATQCLDRAFNALAPNSTPEPSCIAWLTSARLILAAAEAEQRIEARSSSLHFLYKGEKAHWRHRFYELLNQDAPHQPIGLQPRFFGTSNLTTFGRTPIEERSIRVIYDFSEWPPEEVDSIERVLPYTNEELLAMRATMAGVRAALTQRRNL